MNKIDFIGIGAQKSGTSWLYKCLMEHPEICTTKEKEIHYFNKHYSNGVDWYENHFSNCGGKTSGEFSTLYLSDKDVPERIYDYNKDIKIIVSLRNPVDRAYSHYNHIKSLNLAPGENIQEVIKKYPEMIENGMYGKYLAKYFELFPRDQILILFYDDLNKEPLNFVKKIYSFLEVDESFVPSGINSKYHSTKVRGSFVYKKMNKTHLILSKSYVGKHFMKFLSLLGINSVTIQNLLNLITPDLTHIKGDDKKFLYSFFKEDIVHLEEMLGINLNHWKL